MRSEKIQHSCDKKETQKKREKKTVVRESHPKEASSDRQSRIPPSLTLTLESEKKKAVSWGGKLAPRPQSSSLSLSLK
jgi:hypothetical protein